MHNTIEIRKLRKKLKRTCKFVAKLAAPKATPNYDAMYLSIQRTSQSDANKTQAAFLLIRSELQSLRTEYVCQRDKILNLERCIKAIRTDYRGFHSSLEKKDVYIQSIRMDYGRLCSQLTGQIQNSFDALKRIEALEQSLLDVPTTVGVKQHTPLSDNDMYTIDALVATDIRPVHMHMPQDAIDLDNNFVPFDTQPLDQEDLIPGLRLPLDATVQDYADYRLRLDEYRMEQARIEPQVVHYLPNASPEDTESDQQHTDSDDDVAVY